MRRPVRSSRFSTVDSLTHRLSGSLCGPAARALVMLGVALSVLCSPGAGAQVGSSDVEVRSASSDQQPDQQQLEARAREILGEAPLIDGHNDAPWSIRRRFSNQLEGFDFGDTSKIEQPMHTDLARLRSGGVGGQVWSVWVPVELEPEQAVVALLEQIDLVHRLIERYPEDLELALEAADVERIFADGKVACMIGVEGSHSVGDSLSVLRQAFRLGARYLTLTHWDATGWSDSATAEPRHGGLSEEGKAAVLEMNRLGMMVDLSHASWAAMRDALDISRAPVIFSHSDAAALNSYPRNVPDDVLERLRENDGLVMVNFAAFFVSAELVTRVADLRAEEARLEALYPGDPEEAARLLEQWNDTHPLPRVRIADLVDHIDHIRNVAGVDHVGIGSDFDGIRLAPEGLEDVSGYPALLAELLRRGYSDEDVAKIAGGSFLRVMRRVEQVASELESTELSADPARLLVAD